MTLKVPALEKLLDYSASGIGAVAGPMLVPWKARREAKAKRIEAEATAGNLKLIAEAQTEARRSLLTPDEGARVVLDGARVVLDIDPDGIRQRIEFQEQKRQANIVSVVQDAAAELDGKEVDDHEPDPDWTARFFDSVQDISSEDMRKIWARILSGEVEEPGRTSLRTLDVLRNMTAGEARIFEHICRSVVRDISNNSFLFSEERNDIGHLGMPFDQILYLQEIELIGAGPSLQKRIVLDDQNRTVLFFHDEFLISLTGHESRDSRIIGIPAYRLTNPGKELHRIVECELRWDYLQPLARFLRTQNLAVSCARIIERRPDGLYKHTGFFDPFGIESESSRGTTP